MKKQLRRLIPEIIILQYHRLLASAASWRYGRPSRRMIVIGVTGTKGKTSTVNYIWSVLMSGGYKTGVVSTANIRIGEQESMNQYHMTMPGRSRLQRLLRQMADAGCDYCIVETTSEGIKQYRHTGIAYDIGIFTNLSPEHLDSHGGSFERYKRTKGRMFDALQGRRKRINNNVVSKLAIVNRDSEYADYFLQFAVDTQYTFAVDGQADYRATHARAVDSGVEFKIGRRKYRLAIQGVFNVYNSLPAVIIGEYAGITDEKIKRGLQDLATIPGRMEMIEAGQDFRVIIDYAHEQESMQRLLDAAHAMKATQENKIVLLLGAEGGGRDKAKRPIMGEQAGRLADYVVVSNVDPYEDDPTRIVRDIADAATAAGKQENKDLFVIEDRRQGIAKALELVDSGDIVLITGKGSEQSIVVDGISSPWDDRDVTREELRRILSD